MIFLKFRMIDNTLFGQVDNAQAAITMLKKAPKGCQCGISGGKDSYLLYHLCKRAGVDCTFFHAITTIDPPQVIRFIKKYMPDVELRKPKQAFFKVLKKKKMLPIRMKPWCCALFKHFQSKGKYTILGVRAEESPRRKLHKLIHTGGMNPILN